MNCNFLFQQMKERAEAVSAKVSTSNGIDGAVEYAVAITARSGGRTIAAPGIGPDASEALCCACSRAGLEMLYSPLRNRAEDIYTGLTVAQWGIAETGTLVLDSASEEIRIATMLAQIHVAVLPAAKILADSRAVETKLNELQYPDKPAYTSFITGASRTADIERVLAIGVHGPKQLHILIVEEPNQ